MILVTKKHLQKVLDYLHSTFMAPFANRAVNDSEGNKISESYLPLHGKADSATTSDYAVNAGHANEATHAQSATNDINGKNIVDTYYAKPTEVASGTVNWNTLTKPTVYKIQKATMTATYNAPVGECENGILIVSGVKEGATIKRISQVYYPHTPVSNQCPAWTRTCENGTWTGWTAFVSKKYVDDALLGNKTAKFGTAEITGKINNLSVPANSNINSGTGTTSFVATDSAGQIKLKNGGVVIKENVKLDNDGGKLKVQHLTKQPNGSWSAGAGTVVANLEGNVAWGNITGKPSTYPATAHDHNSSYPSTGGARATGTWNISISGKANTAGTADVANKVEWGKVANRPSSLPANGGTADLAKVSYGRYTGNGGVQPPSYFGRERAGFLMSNQNVNGHTGYKNWLYMDNYSGNDVGGASAIGVARDSCRAFIMNNNNSNRAAWTGSAEIITTANIGSYNSSTCNVAKQLGKDGGTGGPMKFHWSGQGGQPSWLWGGNNGTDMYVYNPANFNVARVGGKTLAEIWAGVSGSSKVAVSASTQGGWTAQVTGIYGTTKVTQGTGVPAGTYSVHDLLQQLVNRSHTHGAANCSSIRCQCDCSSSH